MRRKPFESEVVVGAEIVRAISPVSLRRPRDARSAASSTSRRRGSEMMNTRTVSLRATRGAAEGRLRIRPPKPTLALGRSVGPSVVVGCRIEKEEADRRMKDANEEVGSGSPAIGRWGI